MVDTTETYWSVDGTSLQTLAYNIQTWGGSVQALPMFRGADVTVPSRPGQIWQPKTPDSRTLSFDMWVQGSDVDGKPPVSMTMRKQFEENWLKLRSLFWTPGRQFFLTKRFYPMGSSTLTTASTYGEWAGGLVPNMTGSHRAVFSVDVKLTDPFFVGDSVSNTFSSNNLSQQITVRGDYLTNDMTITMTGPLTNPVVTVSNVGYLKVNKTINSGEIITIDVDAFSALYNNGSTPYYASGLISSSVPGQWLYLNPGINFVAVSADSGSGSVTVAHRPKWL